jgi:hypothetical protein
MNVEELALRRATAKGTAIDVDEWGRPLYVIAGRADQGFTGHKPLPDGKCEHRWRNRQTKVVTCRYADGWHAGQVDSNAAVRASAEALVIAFRRYCVSRYGEAPAVEDFAAILRAAARLDTLIDSQTPSPAEEDGP